jgi:hypothetical protein
MDFFTKAKAQTLDSIVRASIPYDPPDTTRTPFPTPTEGPREIGPEIFLEADKEQLPVGETINFKVRIDTKGEFIKNFSFTVKYDPLYFQIKDMDPSQPNTQILYLDGFFNALSHEVDTTTGNIYIVAEAQDGTATISGRNVAEFELVATQEGTSQVTLVVEGSSLVSQNNVNILDLQEDQSTDVIISNTVVTIIPTTDNALIPSTTIPATAIFDNLGSTQAFLVGALLIGIGAYLYNIQRNANQED